MHAYRTHTCGALTAADASKPARLSGWVHSKRDHGGLLFIDLRDHYGLTQCVFPAGSPAFAQAEALRPESVITVTGEVVLREAATVNPRLPTGQIELRVTTLDVQSNAEVLPIQVAGDEKYPDDLRLKYRFIDLRRDKVHRNIMLRAKVITSIRRRMIEPGFHRIPDADPDRVLARGRAGLPGARPQPSGQVLRPAAGAAAVQAARHGRRLRPVFPDRALLSRRGGACRPLAGRILPARFRDELRYPGRRVQHDRAGDRRRVRGVRGRPWRDQAALRAHSLRAGDAGIRFRQAGPAQPAAHHRCHRAIRRVGFRPVRPHRRLRRRGPGHPGSGRGRQPAQLLRQAERMGPHRGRRRAGLHHVRRGRPERPDRAQPGSRPRRGDPRCLRPAAGRRRVLRRRQEGRGAEILRPGAHKARRRSSA